MKIILLACFFLLAIPTTTEAAWWILQMNVSPNTKTRITFDKYEFKLGDMACGATKTDFLRFDDGSVTESRELYCWIADDTLVSVIVNCDYPLYSTLGIYIKKGSDSYYPMLTCGPVKKEHN